MKKILIGIGTITAVATPIITVVSCGSEKLVTFTMNFKDDNPTGILAKMSDFTKENRDAKIIKIVAINKDGSREEKTFDSKFSQDEGFVKGASDWIANLLKKGYNFIIS